MWNSVNYEPIIQNSMSTTFLPHRSFALFIAFILVFALQGRSQVGIGTTTPNANAILDLDIH